MIETWKPVPWSSGFYEVSDLGNVRSCERDYPRKNGRIYRAPAKPVRPKISDGYLRVRLNVPGFPKWHFVHKLVLEAFVWPRPKGKVIRHRDGNPANNRLGNLKYGTNAENQADRRRHGTWHNVTSHRSLTDLQVKKLRELRSKGETLKELSEIFGVSVTVTSMICLGKMYADAPGPILEPLSKMAHRKLPEETAREIVKRRLAGEKIVPLGKEFGISHSYISTLVKRYQDESEIRHAAE